MLSLQSANATYHQGHPPSEIIDHSHYHHHHTGILQSRYHQLPNNTLPASVTNDAHFAAYPAHVAPFPLQLLVADDANVSAFTRIAPRRLLTLLAAQSNDGARLRHRTKRLQWAWLGTIQL